MPLLLAAILGLGLCSQDASAKLPMTPIKPIERSGCCSWHGGVCGCSGGRAVCCDGQLSPSCGCN